ncbi:LOW QUALITY PROTEIN: hypothetical protein Cgig2_015443 [Carnegiea gigantea]|uniref:Uncharacterized protein n=1 Tax=Carnegiea gigantea TaxID=171969 RepID=A0A9Q1JG03_9CARY|nr:LOW QUALITY PROTEIN: hypothetical protein Cgig2_015443 [Carnegiea gigantea]
MDANCGSQRVPLKNGKEEVQKGALSYSHNDEKSCINISWGYANFLVAIVLGKVNTESNEDEKFLVAPSVSRGAIEWTEHILKHFEHTLILVGIYGVVGASVTHTILIGIHFVLPYQNKVIRPQNFVMVYLMAKDQKISPAPIVLGYIYHSLQQVTIILIIRVELILVFPFAKTFPTLYSQQPYSECLVDYPTLMHYAGIVWVSRSLKIPYSIVDKSHLSIVEISWLTSKVEEAFNAAEASANMKGLMSNDFIFYLLKILHTHLKLLTWKATLKSCLVRLYNLNLGEKEILKEKERRIRNKNWLLQRVN